jgi:hypothetical protein
MLRQRFSSWIYKRSFMPKVEGTFKPPSLRVTGTRTPKTQTLPSQKLYQRNPQIYTHRTVSKPLFNSGQCRSFSKTHSSHNEHPAQQRQGTRTRDHTLRRCNNEIYSRIGRVPLRRCPQQKRTRHLPTSNPTAE